MTPEQVNLITQSFDEMWPIRRNLAVRFNARFFEIAPDAQRLFPKDMERLHLKLMDTIAKFQVPKSGHGERVEPFVFINVIFN
jgi:hypothetical protein